MPLIKKTSFTVPTYCDVCRKRITEGKLIGVYEKYVPNLCDSCFEKYFSISARYEKQGFTDIRPCDIRKNEYRLHYKTEYVIVREMISWFLICTLSVTVLKAVCGIMFKEAYATPLPALVIFAVLSLISAVLSIDSLRLLIVGFLRGADRLRRFLLFLESAEYLVSGILILKYMLNWR